MANQSVRLPDSVSHPNFVIGEHGKVSKSAVTKALTLSAIDRVKFEGDKLIMDTTCGVASQRHETQTLCAFEASVVAERQAKLVATGYPEATAENETIKRYIIAGEAAASTENHIKCWAAEGEDHLRCADPVDPTNVVAMPKHKIVKRHSVRKNLQGSSSHTASTSLGDQAVAKINSDALTAMLNGSPIDPASNEFAILPQTRTLEEQRTALLGPRNPYFEGSAGGKDPSVKTVPKAKEEHPSDREQQHITKWPKRWTFYGNASKFLLSAGLNVVGKMGVNYLLGHVVGTAAIATLPASSAIFLAVGTAAVVGLAGAAIILVGSRLVREWGQPKPKGWALREAKNAFSLKSLAIYGAGGAFGAIVGAVGIAQLGHYAAVAFHKLHDVAATHVVNHVVTQAAVSAHPVIAPVAHAAATPAPTVSHPVAAPIASAPPAAPHPAYTPLTPFDAGHTPAGDAGAAPLVAPAHVVASAPAAPVAPVVAAPTPPVVTGPDGLTSEQFESLSQPVKDITKHLGVHAHLQFFKDASRELLNSGVADKVNAGVELLKKGIALGGQNSHAHVVEMMNRDLGIMDLMRDHNATAAIEHAKRAGSFGVKLLKQAMSYAAAHPA